MKKNILKFLFSISIILISFIYTIKWLDDINLQLDEETIDILIKSSSNLNKENKIVNSIVTTITENNYMNPVNIMLKKYSSVKEEPKIETLIPSVSPIEKKPIVYIYNTHQTEKYSSVSDTINLNFSVLDASFLLKEELKKYNIESIVEKGSIKDILDTNNWNYASSYKVSRMYLENAIKKNSSLKYFIDLHRDSVSKKISTVEINGKKYAKTMFLLGLENDDYKENQKILEKLELWLDVNYPGLSRGIYEKKGAGVNGVYNQDFSENCILIEVGGEENNTEEVSNTIEVIAKMFDEYIGENYE